MKLSAFGILAVLIELIFQFILYHLDARTLVLTKTSYVLSSPNYATYPFKNRDSSNTVLFLSMK